MKTNLVLVVIAVAVVLAPLPALAATQSVTETASYTLGDNDTVSAGRQSCIAKAKAAVLDRAGSLIESDLVARQSEAGGEMTDEARLQARSYVAAVVSSELLAQGIESRDGRATISCTVRINFDPDEIRRKLQSMAGDNDLRRKLEAQQAKIDTLSRQIQAGVQNSGARSGQDTQSALPREMQSVNRGKACEALERAGDLAQALFQCSTAIELNPSDYRPYGLRCLVHDRLHEYAQALDDCNAVLRIGHRSPATLINRGIAYAGTGRLDLALTDLNAAIQERPVAEAFNSRGLVFYHLHLLDRAIADFDTALRLRPDLAVARRNRDMAYRALTAG